jgi:uncharacterized protein YaeQ
MGGMATKPTIYKFKVQVSDMDRNFYEELALTVAQHPSETAERVMVRLVAFLFHASDGLKFTEGISGEDDEPDIWEKSRTGEIETWIEVGLPDEKRIKKACNKAKKVFIYVYGGREVPIWWRQIADISKHKNLKVVALPQQGTRQLEELAQRTVSLNCTIQNGQMWIGDGSINVFLEPALLLGGA